MRSFFAPAEQRERAVHEGGSSLFISSLLKVLAEQSSTQKQRLEQKDSVEPRLREKTEANEDKYSLWTSRRYVEAAALVLGNEKRLLKEEFEGQRQQIANQLRADIKTFVDEHAFLRSSVVYEYDISGVRNGYTESLSSIAHNFVELLREAGGPLDRALLEEKVALYIESWMRNGNVKLGERLLLISPRGTKEELYPGLNQENYVFVNIFEKTASGFLFRQYRNYEPNAALPSLQTSIVTHTHGDIVNLAPKEEFANKDHVLIASAIHIPTDAQLEHITEILYKNKADWPINIDSDLPQLDELAMAQLTEKITGFCLEKFDQLITEDRNISEKITAYDQLLYYVRKALLKWSETHASNYDLKDKIIYQLDIQEIETAWQLQRKKSRGEKLAKHEETSLTSFTAKTALDVTLPFKSAASWAHCIIGSPTSMMKMVNQFGGNISSGFGVPSEFMTMSPEEKTELRKQLERLIKITVHGEVWYVPADYMEEPGCYWDEAQQSVVGPCGIPLTADSYAITEAEYNQLLTTLNQTDVLDPLATLPEDEQAQVLGLCSIALESLVLKTAGLEANLTGSILVDAEDVPEPLHSLYELALTSPHSAFSAILIACARLVRNGLTSEIKAIEKIDNAEA